LDEDFSVSQDIAFILAEYAASLQIRDLPASTIAATKLDIFDTLSTTIAGTSSPGIGELLSLIQEWGGSQQATVLVHGSRVPAQHAAWVNASMAHANDYDDTHDAAMLHAGVTVIPAALAAAELAGGAGGDELLVGVTAGLDAVCRLGLASTIGIVESGFIYTQLLGTFGATIAAGRLMGLTPAEMVNALGIAYSQTSGNYQVIRDSALTKRIQPGFAAQAALISVQMAKKGIRGTQNTFQGIDGFYRVFLRDRYDPGVITAGLGTHFEHEHLSFKLYPCMRPMHVPIDAALEAREKWQLAPERIHRVELRFNEHTYSAGCTPLEAKKAPCNPIDAQFSIPYAVAAALVHGQVCLADFTSAAVRRREVLDLAAKIDGVIDEELERGWRARVCPTIIRIETTDGQLLEHRVDHPRRMNQTGFARKLADCIAFSGRPMPRDMAANITSLVEGLESLPDISQLVRAMIAAPARSDLHSVRGMAAPSTCRSSTLSARLLDP
jgi:2-methylcitrate dehydratase PrpD